MPEMPELYAFRNYIEQSCLDKKVQNVYTADAKMIKVPFSLFKKSLIGTRFEKVTSKGKFLIIDISSSDKKMVMHFGLSGSLFYAKNNKVSAPHSVVSFMFNDDSVLHWDSIRKFGRIWLVKTIDSINELKNLGFDPLKITQKQFLTLADNNKKKNIKSFLMDQTIIGGIGNEYSDEIVFQAGVDPHHSINDLSHAILTIIFKQMKIVLRYAIKVRVKTINMVGHQSFSKADRYLFKSTYLQAHRHIDMICPKNKKHILKKTKIAGRTAFYCPIDQK